MFLIFIIIFINVKAAFSLPTSAWGDFSFAVTDA